jgi:ribose 5-phosphate isomerase B
MKLYLGADHGGFELKNKLVEFLKDQNYQLEDLGADSFQADDDYPDYAVKVARAVAKNPDESLGILLCRSGGGMVIAANKVKGIRAVDCFNQVSAEHAKKDNDANVITLGADWLDFDQAKKIVKTFIKTEFSQAPRHIRRIKKIVEIERN